MWWFLGLLGEYIGGFFICLFIIGSLVTGIFWLIKALYPKYQFTIISYSVGILLFTLLFVQSIMIYGAASIKSEINYYTELVQTQINKYYNTVKGTLTDSDVKNLTEKLVDEYPILSNFIDAVEIENYDIEHIAENYTAGISAELTAYIWRRIGWSLLFFAVGTFAIVKSCEGGRTKNNKTNKRASYRERMHTYRH